MTAQDGTAPRRSAGGNGAAGAIVVHVDGRALQAVDGQTLLGALLAQGVRVLRHNAVTGEARGGYCGMGVCFECEVEVDGRPQVRACMEPARDGQRVRLGQGSAGPRAAAEPGVAGPCGARHRLVTP